MNPLVSVIIPVYNSETFLEMCLDSIANQTYKNVEVLVVDDGSTDESGRICDKYAEADKRFRIFHKENGGQASARNMALEVMNGEYVTFVDSDDVLASDYLDYMMNLLQSHSADIVHCDYLRFWKNEELDGLKRKAADTNSEQLLEFTTEQALENFSYQRYLIPGPFAKIFKSEMWNGLRFPEKIGYEDYAVMYKVYGNAQKVVYNRHFVYFYRVHGGSTQHNVFSEKKKDRITISTEFSKYVSERYPEILKATYYRYCLACMQYLMEMPLDSKYSEEKKDTYLKLKQHRKDVISDKKAPTSMKLMLLSSFLGANALVVLGKLYMKVTKR